MAKLFASKEVDTTTEVPVEETSVSEVSVEETPVIVESEAEITQETVAEEVKPVSMSDIINPVQEEKPVVVEAMASEVTVEPVHLLSPKRFEIKNKLAQHIHLANGSIVPERGVILVEEITSQMLTLKQRGFITIKEV